MTPQNVVLVGATGLIGAEIADLLTGVDHLVVRPATRHTEPGLDLENPESIEAFFDELGPFDHLIVSAGEARFGRPDELDAESLSLGIRSKLMGQVNAAMSALRRLPDGGSVTLTSGALSHTPIPGSAAVALANGAIDSFVRAVALDLPAGRRINAVSPGWIKETMLRMGLDPSSGTSARDVAQMYLDALSGSANGVVFEARAGLQERDPKRNEAPRGRL